MPQDRYTLRDIARRLAVPLAADAPAADAPLEHYVYDTRLLVQPQQAVFLALPGEARDGHRYAQAAYEAGVRAFWLARPLPLPADAAQLVVPDVLAALQQHATQHRQQFGYPVVGITGSNGKTIVKDWLATLLESPFEVYKSPGSWNSQLGVALALLGLRSHHNLALIEAGISQQGEMAPLAQMIRPTHGILTHMGDAHAEGFPSFEAKLAEKCSLFMGDIPVVADAALTHAPLALPPGLLLYRATIVPPLTDIAWRDGAWHIPLRSGAMAPLVLPVAGEAARDNLLLVLAACELLLGPQALPTDLPARVADLQPVSMRTELISDNPELTVLNDAYNADAASVRNALSLLAAQRTHPHRRLILTDLDHQGRHAEATQRELLALAVQQFGAESVQAIGPRNLALAPQFPGLAAYPDVRSLLQTFDYERYRNATVLLKGARRWQLEQLIPYLTRHPGATHLKINLNALRDNLRTVRRLLPPGTRVLAMLKAAAYGSGAWQLAQELEREGVEGFAVAQPLEGIELRQRGIRTPILVLSPDPQTLALLPRHDLEPVIWSFALLRQWAAFAQGQPAAERLGLHLEFDTGMARLGFAPSEVHAVLHEVRAAGLRVASVMTHLAASEDPAADAFTNTQLDQFDPVAAAVRQAFPDAVAHALNTGGILRHAARGAYQQVRLGIGLYGVSPVEGATYGLREIGSLHTAIAQIHDYPAGTPVGYGRSEVLPQPARIATLPIGYADGLPRSLGNRKAQVLIRGQQAPIVGRICMDLLMVDVTHIPGASEGDEVVIFGAQGDAFQSVNVLATAAGTIAYELLAGISPRVRRVYGKE